MLPIKTLPIVEHWECAGCGRCCRGSLIWLNEEDLRKLRDQGWANHPDFAHTPILVREGWFRGRQRLAQRADGSCVFLLPDGRCRIHAEHGADAKPLVCRMFPLQLVPLEHHAVLTLRRACPTAAADKGPELNTYRALARELAQAGKLLDESPRAPALTRSVRGTWRDAETVATSLQRILNDANLPLVRRLAHGLHFCALLEECRLKGFDMSQLGELCSVLEGNCRDVSDLFASRDPPSAAAGILFRQIAAHYVRLHPTFSARETWGERWRMARMAVAMTRGKGQVPHFLDGFPDASFESLERPLGHLDEAVQRPFLQFFATQVASRQFIVASRPSWSLVESFRALALAYPVGLWLLRWLSADAPPSPELAIDIVTMLDRGQGYAPLTSRQHRSRINTLAQLGDLERLVVWYAR